MWDSQDLRGTPLYADPRYSVACAANGCLNVLFMTERYTAAFQAFHIVCCPHFHLNLTPSLASLLMCCAAEGWIQSVTGNSFSLHPLHPHSPPLLTWANLSVAGRHETQYNLDSV